MVSEPSPDMVLLQYISSVMFAISLKFGHHPPALFYDIQGNELHLLEGYLNNICSFSYFL